MAKLKTGQITAKRAYEMADSLSKSSKTLSYVGNRLADRSSSSSERKKDWKDKNPSVINLTGIPGETKGTTIKGVKEMKNTSEKYKNLASSNMQKADMLTSRANAATGRDTPLPSSEGLFSKIKNIFN